MCCAIGVEPSGALAFASAFMYESQAREPGFHAGMPACHRATGSVVMVGVRLAMRIARARYAPTGSASAIAEYANSLRRECAGSGVFSLMP